MISSSRHWLMFVGSRVLAISVILLLITVDFVYGPFGPFSVIA